MGGGCTRIFLGILWGCCLHDVFAAPILNSAQPPSALTVLDSIVCEGQKAFLMCQNIYDQIEIVETMYGRRDASTCVHPTIPSNALCQEQATQVNAQIKGLCEGESACQVSANNNFMAKAGTTICPNVYKYLEIKYKCIPRTFYPSVNSGTEGSQSVSEVITTGGAVGLGSSSVASSSYSSSVSGAVPELTVKEHEKTQPVKAAISQASVIPIDPLGSSQYRISKEFAEPENESDVVTETFSSNAASSQPAEEVNEMFKKSHTPPRPDETGDERSGEESGSGEWDGFDDQRDIVYDDDKR